MSHQSREVSVFHKIEVKRICKFIKSDISDWRKMKKPGKSKYSNKNLI